MSSVSKIKNDGVLYDIEDSTARADISELRSEISSFSAIPVEVKRAMDTLFQNVAFKNDTDYSAYRTVIHAWANEITVASISSVYEQTKPVYSFYDLDTLRDDLVVTAQYTDGTSGEISTYELNGTLTEGTSTITASFNGKTSTFTVTVSGKEFSYSPNDGSLITQPYLVYTKPENMSETVTWSLTDGTIFDVPSGSSLWSRLDFHNFNFAESAHFVMEFKLTQLAYYGSTNTTSPGEFTVNLRDEAGMYGATVGFARDGAVNSAIKIRTASGGSTIAKGTTVSLNEWHTLDIVIANNTQTVLLDETEVLTNASPSTGFDGYFSGHSCIGISSHATSSSHIYIKSVEYSAD